MESRQQVGISRGQWLALTAALLGWMFDGFEMGLFPVIARPALTHLIEATGGEANDKNISDWNALINASFLIGAATGGVVFGWLGDRLGRVRAMSLSILTYALCSGLGGVVSAPWQMVGVRFLAALGMGGEWSLGVALVMEIWGERSRALLAGLIGAAANVGYMLVALLSLSLGGLSSWLREIGLGKDWVEWRLLLVCGALPAVLTFFVRLWVPESERWQREQKRGATSSWASRDLLAVLGGVGVCAVLIVVWQELESLTLRLGATVLALALVAGCYLFPIVGYLGRSGEQAASRALILRRMLLAALISGVPLLATWGAVQWASVWAHKLGQDSVEVQRKMIGVVGGGTAAAGSKGNLEREDAVRYWKEYTQLSSALGAVVGSLGGALLAGWIGRRIAYIILCLTSLGAVLLFYQRNATVDAQFLTTAFFAGGFSAAFYGWLPLYLPELFPTRVRATGQGFGFNFGRIIAAIGVLQVPVLMGTPPDYARACSLLALIYILGLFVIWLAPETKGRTLPE